MRIRWAVALPFVSQALVQAVHLDANAENGIYTFERQADGGYLTKRELDIEQTYAYNQTYSLKLAKRDTDAPSQEEEPKIPEPPLKNYPENWETVPLPNSKKIGCPERHEKIRTKDYNEAIKMLEHFCKYYHVSKRGNVAFVNGGAVVYACNYDKKKAGICSVGEFKSAENDMNKECSSGYPAWADYGKPHMKIYGRDIAGNSFCHTDEQVLRYDLHKISEKAKGQNGAK